MRYDLLAFAVNPRNDRFHALPEDAYTAGSASLSVEVVSPLPFKTVTRKGELFCFKNTDKKQQASFKTDASEQRPLNSWAQHPLRQI